MLCTQGYASLRPGLDCCRPFRACDLFRACVPRASLRYALGWIVVALSGLVIFSALVYPGLRFASPWAGLLSPFQGL